MRFRGDQALFYLFLLGLMVPLESTVVPLYYDLRDLGLTDTYAALILPAGRRLGRVRDVLDARVLPLGAALAGGGRAARRLLELEHAVARGRCRSARPAVLTMTVLVFMWTWNEFLLALVMVSEREPAHRAARPGVLLGPQHDRLRAAGRRLGDRGDAGRDRLRLPPAPLHPRDAVRGGEGLMASVAFDRVTKRFDSVEAVRELTLEARDGEFLVLVGPSGSGKTTALRMLAGLESISEGEIRIGERVDQPRRAARARHRDGLPGLRAVPADDGLRQPRVRAAAAQGAEGRDRRAGAPRGGARSSSSALLERKPRQLSGGQQQRVALGRALVRDPQVFLMDEPLSNLDAKLRVQTRGEIKQLQQEVGTTTVYVTHDQVEAMTMGDRIAVMNEGRLEQVGTPAELYEQPANTFVAGFIGSPGMSFAPAERLGLEPAGRDRRRAAGVRAAVAGRPGAGRSRARSSTSRRSGARRSWASTRHASCCVEGRAAGAGRRHGALRPRARRPALLRRRDRRARSER